MEFISLIILKTLPVKGMGHVCNVKDPILIIPPSLSMLSELPPSPPPSPSPLTPMNLALFYEYRDKFQL